MNRITTFIIAAFLLVDMAQADHVSISIPHNAIPTPDLTDIHARLDALEDAMAAHNHGAPDPELPVDPEPEPGPDPVPPPVSGAPYDLGPLPVFVADIEWPEPPTITNEVSVSSDGDWTMQNGTRYIVAAGNYGPKTVTCNHCEFILADDAVINGELTFVGHHIVWRGGRKVGPGNVNYSGNGGDLLIDNFHGISETARGINNFSGGRQGWSRIALINTTLEVRGNTDGGGWAFFTQRPIPPDPRQWIGTDLIFANVKFIGDGQNNRVQTVEDHVVVDSYYNPTVQSTNGHRVHASKDVYMRDSIVVGGANHDVYPQITNGLFERLQRYDILNIPFSNGIGTNGENVTIRDSQVFVVRHNGNFSPPPLGGAAGENPGMQPWDGVTVPDASGYGADH